jgi:hypothetical protein
VAADSDAAGRRQRQKVGSDGDHGPNSMALLKQFRELFRLSQRHFQRIESMKALAEP